MSEPFCLQGSTEVSRRHRIQHLLAEEGIWSGALSLEGARIFRELRLGFHRVGQFVDHGPDKTGRLLNSRAGEPKTTGEVRLSDGNLSVRKRIFRIDYYGRR